MFLAIPSGVFRLAIVTITTRQNLGQSQSISSLSDLVQDNDIGHTQRDVLPAAISCLMRKHHRALRSSEEIMQLLGITSSRILYLNTC